MQWYTQAENITTNLKFKEYFTLPALSATNVKTWKFHMGDSAKGRNNMILGRDLLKGLGLSLNYMNISSKLMMDLLKGLQHPWFIWACIYLNI